MLINKEFINQSTKEHLVLLKMLYKKIPTNLLTPSLFKSWFYFFFDVFCILGLFFSGFYLLNNELYYLIPFYIFLQGSFFWSLFVIGHDCGHESFSWSNFQNNLVGFISHSFLLVPFYSWKLTHLKHHLNHNSVENDETHVAVPLKDFMNFQKSANKKSFLVKLYFKFYYYLEKIGLGFILYLFDNHIMKDDSFSHYNPHANVFKNHKKMIYLSAFFVCLMLGSLIYLSYIYSFLYIFILYFLPWLVYNFWLYFVTYLQHMNDKNYWFYQKDWTFLKGAFQTVDYDYGKFLGPLVNFFHHNIQRYHVVHHLNFKIPHYNLKKVHEILFPEYKDVYLLQKKPLKNFILFKFKYNLMLIQNYNKNSNKYSLLKIKQKN